MREAENSRQVIFTPVGTMMIIIGAANVNLDDDDDDHNDDNDDDDVHDADDDDGDEVCMVSVGAGSVDT